MRVMVTATFNLMAEHQLHSSLCEVVHSPHAALGSKGYHVANLHIIVIWQEKFVFHVVDKDPEHKKRLYTM